MKSRIDQVADPDVDIFNIAMPNKSRLPVFESLCLQKPTQRGKRGGKKVAQKMQRNTQFKQQKNNLQETALVFWPSNTSINSLKRLWFELINNPL